MFDKKYGFYIDFEFKLVGDEGETRFGVDVSILKDDPNYF